MSKRIIANKDDLTQENLILMYWDQRMSLTQCAHHFNLSLAGMWLWFKKLGVATENKRRQPREERWNYNGGRSIDSNGYVVLTIPNYPGSDARGRVYEHRYVMEQILGHALREDEEVHHKNEIKSDNRPENLEVKEEKIHKSEHHKQRYYVPKIICSYKNCTREASARKLCAMHYLQEWAAGTIDSNPYNNHNLKRYWSSGMKKVFLLMGESGSGKTEISKILKNKKWEVLESYTTRNPRHDGEYGHIFCSIEEYEQFLKHDQIVAYSYFENNHYFSTRDQIHSSDIYIVDPDGIEYLKQKVVDIEFVTIYLTINKDERVKRMEIRGDSKEQVAQRLSVDDVKFQNKSFDYMVQNKNLKSTAEIVNTILKKEKEYELDYGKGKWKK